VQPENCDAFHGFDLQQAWQENMELRGLPKFSGEKSGLLKPDFRKIKQFTRLTVVGDD